MPTAKDKGGSTSHRCRSASDYDDATLTQKREYWRTKKREQRARLTERRGKSTQDSGGEKRHLHAPAVLNSTLSDSFPAFSTPLQSNDESHKTVNISLASQSGKTMGDSSADAAESQKEKWLHTAKLNKVLPQLPASCSISVKAARGDTATVKSLTAKGAVSRAVTSPTTSGTQLNTCSSVPPVRVTTTTNGSSTKTAPQPCVSMQGASGPKMRHKAQVASRIQPKPQPTNVSTGMTLVSSPCVPISIKTEGKTATPQSGTKSALVTLRRAKGVRSPQPSPDTEDEKAAKRRENWRIKKREQRAKLAAQVAKARERTQSVELTLQRQTAQKTGLVGDTILQHLPSQSFLRGAGQRQQARPSFTSAKRETDKLQSGAASLTTINMQADQVKVQNPRGNRQTAITCDVMSVRKPGELQRKLPNSVHLSYVSRGIARCKTPRQRLIEAQKFFMNQRNMRCKSPLLSSVFGTRNIPQIVISPNDTPEQIIAKRREYWRIKKREQRAKLSMEVKARLKEKDSLMRRVKRYQKILEEMRRARALAQSGGSTLTHASETIGGFIKEDGTVTINIPQVPTGHNTAARKSEAECHVVSNNNSITKPQHQPNTKRRAITPIRVTQPPPPLRPAQVKVSFPLAGHLANKPPRLLSIRPRTQPESTTAPNSHKLAIQTLSQLTLTHPQTPQNAVSGGSAAVTNFGGCVMKMAVSSSVPSLSALSLDPELTEEERMAKKREYWRIKKREQRASRAARLKQGVLQARASATLQRRKAQRQAAVTSVPPGGSHTGSAQSLPNSSAPATPHANEIKHESESVPEVDLNSQPEQAICPDIKPPTSPPTPPPAPQPEPDPALNADSQATTLLAVASMKKLLEESLSTVTEYKSELTDVKKETTEEASEDDMTPNLPELNEVAPIAADLTLEIKSWQPDTDVLVLESSPNPHLKDSPQSSETPPSSPTSNQTVQIPTCEHSSQTPSNFILNPYMEASHSPSSPRRTQRLHTRKAGHQDCCSTESLHHLPMDQLQKPQCEQQCQAENSNLPSAQRYPSVVTEHSGLISLQRKREYWKLMKRQQRARLRARQKERHGECSSRLSSRNIQAPGLVNINTVKGVNPLEKPALQPKPPIASLTAVTSIPTVLVVSPSTCTAEESPDTLQVKLPVTSVSCSSRSEQNSMSVGPSQIISDYQGAHENQQQATPDSQKWMSRSTDVDSVPSLPTLTPPDNPLSSINLQPIEPPCQNLNSDLSPIKMPYAQLQSPTHMTQSPPKLVPVTTMVPPKPIPGECEEDFLRRKREYWRIKKKEQRARKAIQDKGTIPRRASNNLRPILPAQDVQTRDSDQWVSRSSEESQHLMSTSEDTDPGTFPFPNFAAQVEDETELLFTDYENANGEEGPVSEAVWRNRYLMDYDPLNQLLVCMVCGELQYSHSLEGVRAHIDEAHPDTLTLEPREQQQILEAWDEQVSQRERFFTSQLQQHSEALAEEQRD
uniref:uncharacterized protein si:dkey-28a3.2 n=1 Tax=Epinephelus lanceolatus TaxID=310571 RepID=UPI001444B551|nr:uncharacterized protein si:dkey-28a3.2 [Epinephelus lanceolatus]XP_033507861.1 uncharacterized protein si:dkey-28a3.2 [Epinephelus lanceolatus]XP_033507862.1 uncharacterized protein si:dkey-28a3.2 [Epinephelus lanceolatus]XP_033507863.1 uncharacterized protein si:dkey-28a3.2 [Epinephelus lanceolatus]XP_033507864.1 uncharacterized protein si:dkey-28a3.2 [Epinephelus lanceolatus]